MGRRIDAEISLRLDYLASKLLISGAAAMVDLHFAITTSFSGEEGNIYPEYRKVNILSMLALAMLNAPDSEKRKIGRARDAARRLTKQLDGPQPPAATPAYLAQIEATRKNFNELYLQRWRLDAVTRAQ